MMHRPWSSIVEVPYCFSRSNVKFQGHTALKIVKFYQNWAFLDSNSSLNSLMVMKCCTKLETAKERCPIVFQSHPSNFKVTRDKTSSLLTRIGRFRTIGRSQLSNPSDLPCFWWNVVSCFKFHQFLFLSVQLIISLWFKWSNGTEQVPSHYWTNNCLVCWYINMLLSINKSILRSWDINTIILHWISLAYVLTHWPLGDLEEIWYELFQSLF